MPSTGEAESKHIQFYEKKLRNWNRQARALRFTQAALAALAIVSSVLAAAEVSACARPILTATAAVSIALFTGLSVSHQANKLRNAWRELMVAVREYKETAPNNDITRVRDAYDRSEKIINTYDPNVNG